MQPTASLNIDRPISLALTVAERLRQAIIDAEIALGSELTETGVAAMLGVSRTPVREALSLLQQQGLVSVQPQRGSYVFLPTEQDIIDLCEYRVVLEQRAVQLSMARQHDETLADLREAIAAMEAARAGNDPVAYSRADTQFHESFIRHCRNRYLQEGYAHVSGPISTLRTHLSVPVPGAQENSYVHHRQIAEAFAAGDVPLIESILSEHILATRQSYLTVLKDGRFGVKPSGRKGG